MQVLLRLTVLLAALGAVPAMAAGPDGEALSQACTSCHGIDGTSPGAMPALAGRPKDELISLMLAFREEGSEATIMNRIVRGYTNDELAALAAYFSNVDVK